MFKFVYKSNIGNNLPTDECCAVYYNNEKLRMVQKVQFELDAADMVPKLTLTVIPQEIIVEEAKGEPSIKNLTLRVMDCQFRDQNGMPFNRAHDVSSDQVIYVTPPKE
jgi:hypothetical protein